MKHIKKGGNEKKKNSMYMFETKRNCIYMLCKKLKVQGLEQLTLLEAGACDGP